MTHTYALMGVSPATFEEIRAKLAAAGYEHAIHKDREEGLVVDMHGLALVAVPETPEAGWALRAGEAIAQDPSCCDISSASPSQIAAVIAKHAPQAPAVEPDEIKERERLAFEAGEASAYEHENRPRVRGWEDWLAQGKPEFIASEDVWIFPFASSHIARAGYQPPEETGTEGALIVRFVDGALGIYANVRPEWWDGFLKAESKGKFLVGLKRNPHDHPYTALEPRRAKR